jgi:hypothetical protein
MAPSVRRVFVGDRVAPAVEHRGRRLSPTYADLCPSEAGRTLSMTNGALLGPQLRVQNWSLRFLVLFCVAVGRMFISKNPTVRGSSPFVLCSNPFRNCTLLLLRSISLPCLPIKLIIVPRHTSPSPCQTPMSPVFTKFSFGISGHQSSRSGIPNTSTGMIFTF